MKIDLTARELKAVLWCIANFTAACARDTNEMRSNGVENPRVLVAAEAKLLKALSRGARETL